MTRPYVHHQKERLPLVLWTPTTLDNQVLDEQSEQGR